MFSFRVLLVHYFLYTVCICELSFETRDKFIEAFVEHLNHLPDQSLVYGEGEFLNLVENGDNKYNIDVKLRESNSDNIYTWKPVTCSGAITDHGPEGVLVENVVCSDYVETTTEDLDEFVTDITTTRGPIQLDNEVQPNNAYTSGEQFIAVPRDRPAPCIGCSTQVDPQAPGVAELAHLGIRQLDRHEPNTRHALNQVASVERQVQVVGGVRYILTFTVDYNNCTATETEDCYFQKPCKVAVLEKPWRKLPDGSKFRAILSNNCTDEWLFGDNGELSPVDGNFSTEPTGGEIKAVHNSEVQAQPAVEKTLTDEQLRVLQDQIVPASQVSQLPNNDNVNSEISETQVVTNKKEYVNKLESNRQSNDINFGQQFEDLTTVSSLGDDKKKAIDDLMNFFEFTGFDTKNGDASRDNTRMKRDYGADLKLMSLAKNYRNLKTKIENAKFVHSLAQVMVDYINEMEIESKTRSLIDVIGAEEEMDGDQRFFYLQAQVGIPCMEVTCKNKNREEICNGIIELDDSKPFVQYTFCHEENKRQVVKFKNVDTRDPVLIKLVKYALKKIDSESKTVNAYRLKRVVNPLTRTASGILTKFTLELEAINCNNTVPIFKRKNCTLLEFLGSRICDVEVYEKHRGKEKKIVYVCNERSADETFASPPEKNGQNSLSQEKVSDAQVLDILQEALQYLEIKSNRNNKLKLITINSVFKQLIAGVLTNVKFTVGYTGCPNDIKDIIDNCKLLDNEPLRLCQAEVWERPWLDEGRQVEVSCDEISNVDNEISKSSEQREEKDSNQDIHVKKVRRSNADNDIVQDLSHKEYYKLAEEALTQYGLIYNKQNNYKVLSVVKVSTTDTGRLTKIHFTAAPNQNLNNSITCLAEVQKRPELNNRVINIDCQENEIKIRRKRQLDGNVQNPNYIKGGLMNQDSNDPKYKKLAEEAALKYVVSSDSNQHHEVVEIEQVTTQVVAGSLTRIDFKMSPTNCLVDGNGLKTRDKCDVIDPSNILKCNSKILEQPWLNKKEITVNCTAALRNKRNVPGSVKVQDSKDPKYKKLAEESAAKYVVSSGIPKHHQVVKIEKVTTQVVAGLLTRIEFNVSPTNCLVDSCGHKTSDKCEITDPSNVLKCHSEIWEQPWLNKREITVDCTDNKKRSKRDLPILGGETNQDSKDPKYQKLAEESALKYVVSLGMNQHHQVIEIAKVTTQVVSGSMTRIEFKISPTNCVIDSSGIKTYDKCKLIDSSNFLKCNSKIWEQSWLNKKEITVNCTEVEKSKRQVPGGEVDQDPNDSKYKNLAEESAAKYVLSSGMTQHHKVIEIAKVTTQAVSGSLTRIKFKISPTNCLVDSSGHKTSDKCKITNLSNVLKCHSEIWEQPWLNKREITVNCTDNKDRSKRNLPILGGETNQDSKDPKYQKLAEESALKYVLSSGMNQHHQVIEIAKVTTQVVSGSMTRIEFKISPTNCVIDSSGIKTYDKCKLIDSSHVLNCNSKIWEQSWLNKKEITVNCTEFERSKRQVPGGEVDQDPNDSKYKNLAEESAAKYVLSSGMTQHHKVIEIAKVTTQVVSGSLTRIKFKISPTNCLVDSSGHKTSDKCKITDLSNVLECHSEIWEQPWLKMREITVNCTDNKDRSKRDLPILGGETNQDSKDPKYQKLAEESALKYVLSSGMNQHHQVIEIAKVTTQVVSGSVTRIEFKISPTNCVIDSSGIKTYDKCKLIDSSHVLNCNSEIWEQSWLNKKEITVNCTEFERSKRQVRGGEVDQDPNDSKYKNLAEESAAKYVLSSGMTQHHKVIEIAKVTTQVVSGSLTRIKFKISPTNCLVDSSGHKTSDKCTITDLSNVLECHSEIWEQPWLKMREITVNCTDNKDRSKRDLPILGGETNQDSKDPKYQKLAKESALKYVLSSGMNQHHQVIEIAKVTTQVVSGSMTRIEFKISPTNCVIDISGIKTYDKCKLIDSSNVLNCNSEIWEQPWLNKKEITVNCTEVERSKRQVPGGEVDQDPNDSKYKNLAEESAAKYVLSSGMTQHHKVIEIAKVTTQVVSGSLTRIKFKISPTNCLVDSSEHKTSDKCKLTDLSNVLKCHSEIWEQPWLNKREITVNCTDNKDRSKRDLPILGGETNQDSKDPKYQKLAEESALKYVLSSGMNQHHQVIEIAKVTTQVVSGSMTRIEFKISPTNCVIDSSGIKTYDKCKLIDSSHVLNCNSKIWEQSWLNKKEITVNCTEFERSKRQVPGGEVDQDPNDSKYKNLAEESAAKYVLSSGMTQHHKVIEIAKVTTQVVSGSLTRIKFKISPTNCLVDSSGHKTFDKCTITDLSNVLECHSEIWEQPWLKMREITVNCTDNKDRSKRDLPILGGETNQDSKDPKYQKLAEESALKYVLSSGMNQHHQVIEIAKVTTQVVSGSMTRIEFKISPTNCVIDSSGIQTYDKCKLIDSSNVLNCNSEIWEQPWLNKKVVTVNCTEVERSKRQLPGGEVDHDPNDPVVMKLAEESAAKYVLSSGMTQHHKVIEIVKVTTQVVAGSLTRIKFKISPTNCLVDSSGHKTSDKCKVTDLANVLNCDSEIWERAWLNKMEITVDCTADERSKRQVAGDEADRDPNDPKYTELAQESAAKYVLSSGITHHHQVIEIDKVTTQVVSGSLTRIAFKISSTNCLVDNKGVPTSDTCEVSDPLNALKCNSAIWEQPWLNKKEFTVNCTEVPLKIMGEIISKVPNDPKFKILAEEAAAKFVISSGIAQYYEVVEVMKVLHKSRLLNKGSYTKIDFKIASTNCLVDSKGKPTSTKCPIKDPVYILQCHSDIWETLSLVKKKIEVKCVPNNKEITRMGAKVDPKDPKYKKIAEEAAAKYVVIADILQHHKVIDVESVSHHAYYLTNYTKINFRIAPTNCLVDSNGNPTSNPCPVLVPTKVLQCHSTIWLITNVKTIDVDCKPIGGKSSKLKEMAQKAAAKYVVSSGIAQYHKVIQIDKVYTKNIAGTYTKIDFKIAPTDCLVDGDGEPTSTDCIIKDSAPVLQCEAELWEFRFIHQDVVETDCTPIKSRKNNEVVIYGGEMMRNPNDLKYMKLAEESVAQYLVSSGITKYHKVVEIEKVTTQVVSGSITRIDFKISPTDCPIDINGKPTSDKCVLTDPPNVFKCNSVIFEQRWLNKKEVKVNCTVVQQRSLGKGERLYYDDPRYDNVDLVSPDAQNPNDPKYRQLAEEAAAQYMVYSGTPHYHQVSHIDSVNSEIVSGILTKIVFKIAPTDCLVDSSGKPEPTINNSCKLIGNVIFECQSEIWEQHWIHKKEIEVNCERFYYKRKNLTSRKKRSVSVYGGTEDQDTNYSKFKELAKESLAKYLLRSNISEKYGIDEVQKVKTQVVAGIITRIKFTAAPSSCIQNNHNTSSSCMLHCQSKIIERVSPSEKDITVKCSRKSKREIITFNDDINDIDRNHNKRFLQRESISNTGEKRRSGGLHEQDPTKHEYRLLALQSLQKYQSQQKSNFSHKIIKMKRVVTQVVSGIRYKIDYTAGPTTCLLNVSNADKCDLQENSVLYCHTEIWNRPWLKRKQISVFCSENDDSEEEETSTESTFDSRTTSIRRVRNVVPLDLDPKDKKVLVYPEDASNVPLLETIDDVKPYRGNEKLCALDSNKELVDKNKNNSPRGKRQIPPDDEYIDDGLKYYYADRVLSEINQRSDSENLYKLVTIHDIRRSVHMKTSMVRMYVEIALSYCLRHGDYNNLNDCGEIDGTRHEICLGRLWPSRDDELVLGSVNVVCEGDLHQFYSITGILRDELVDASLNALNRSPSYSYYVQSYGETHLIPSLDSSEPVTLDFLIVHTNCSKNDDIEKNHCVIDTSRSPKTCKSLIYFAPNTKSIKSVNVSCAFNAERRRRSISLDPANATAEDLHIQELLQESLEKLESISVHRYKQRILLINSVSSKIASGKQTVIDFDVGYTNCLKFEWVDNITSCDFLEHLPRRHCVSQIWERLWVDNGRQIEVNCDDDETPLEANMEFESAVGAMALANEALKRIEYKYPHARRQKVVRIFTLEKQMVAGLHYRMKMEVGYTDCMALSVEDDCKLVSNIGLNKFCRVNVWIRPWTSHPPSYRVTCDYQEGSTDEIYHQLQAEQLFHHFVSTHKPDYINDHAEMARRFEIFKANVKKIHELNVYEQGTARYAITQFADLSEDEFRRKYKGLDLGLRDENQVPFPPAEIPNVRIPGEFDWREQGAVTEVKDQGSCGSCWAFSVTGNIEGQWKRHSGKLVSLSEQELVDCDKLDNGCNGGLPDNAYRAIEQLGGLETESDYPYEGEDDKCVFNASLSRVQISGAVNITTNETAMAQWLFKNGPISIGINANAMQFYVGGISHPWKMLCNPKNLDHGVLIVGYGEKDYPLFNKKLPYWIVKNSWGKTWGEQGYYRVYRGDGTCGVNQMASSAVV